jgi:hypothetical protein
MPGLSDIHLFTHWDLENNPIKMRISETLKLSAKERNDPFSFKPSSVPQCGTISMKLNQTQWDSIFSILKKESDRIELRKMKAEELCEKINNYLESKCEEYIKVNRIGSEAWFGFATYESYKNKYEIRYKGELICGAKISCELKDNNATEASISLELY